MDAPSNETADAFADWRRVAQRVITDAGITASHGPKIIGISGSQGSGKSTLAGILTQQLNGLGIPAQAVSLDDFYLTQSDRSVLASTVHPLLRTRGVPGTHDVDWLQQVLTGTKAGKGQGLLPRFDKAADDRAGQHPLSCQVLVLEGWCLGVQSQGEAALLEPINDLERDMDQQGIWRRWVNLQIQTRYEPLWSDIDYWLCLQPPGFAQVLQWRRQQEDQLAQARRMDEQSLRRFIEHYERLTRWQWACGPRGPGLHIRLDASHRVERIASVADSP